VTNLLKEAINSSDGNHAAKLIQSALGIQSDGSARIIGEWLQIEARFLAE
jgi:hypothetical protein